MWQMTWDELDQEDVVPTTRHNLSGSVYYSCGICGDLVGIFGPPEFHEKGWIYKRDKCKNGHVVDWKEAINEVSGE